MRVKRISAGSYEVTEATTRAHGKKVIVVRNPMLSSDAQWIAYADWDRYCVTDPQPTKRDAVRCAQSMLEDC